MSLSDDEFAPDWDSMEGADQPGQQGSPMWQTNDKFVPIWAPRQGADQQEQQHDQLHPQPQLPPPLLQQQLEQQDPQPPPLQQQEQQDQLPDYEDAFPKRGRRRGRRGGARHNRQSKRERLVKARYRHRARACAMSFGLSCDACEERVGKRCMQKID